jgi:hypothetical protein
MNFFSPHSSTVLQRRLAPGLLPVLLAILIAGLSCPAARAQGDVGGGDAGACVLKNHVYTCDGAAFQKALANASTVKIETHNADGIARSQLTDFITRKLGKSIAPAGTQPDLDFLLIPIAEGGQVTYTSGSADLGTLRIYSVTPDGMRAHLLWAETYSGAEDLPWPSVVHSLILQFQSRFHIK